MRREERIQVDPGFLHLEHVGILDTEQLLVKLVSFRHTEILQSSARRGNRKQALPGKAVGGAGVGTAMGTPTLPLPLFSRLLLRLLLGWLPPLLPLLVVSRAANTSDHKHTLGHTPCTQTSSESCTSVARLSCPNSFSQ